MVHRSADGAAHPVTQVERALAAGNKEILWAIKCFTIAEYKHGSPWSVSAATGRRLASMPILNASDERSLPPAARRGIPKLSRILAPVMFSRECEEAARYAASLAR